MEFKVNLYRLRENRNIKVETFINLISAALYEKRWGPYFVQPIVVGLEDGKIPMVASYDSIGCTSTNEHF